MNALAQNIQRKVLITKPFTYAYDAADRRVSVVDMVGFGVLYQPQNERRNAHQCVGLKPFDGVPLQFGNAVAHTDNAGAQLAQTQEIRHAGHESFVYGRHQLHHITFAHTCACERLAFVVSQSLQVFLRTAEGHRIAQRAARGDKIDDILARTAQKITVIQL